jgi:hypothetical protein
LQRSQSAKWCGYFEKGNKRFAYVNHRKEQNRIEVWFLGEVDDESKYPHLDIQARTPTSGGFGRDFGARFFLDSLDRIPEAGKLLLNVSHAASLKP